MKKIIVIIPYMGEFPSYFDLWLTSCRYNKSIDWLLITDNTGFYNIPPNVHVIQCSFQELKEKIQFCFEFPVAINTPYKLCDFKPAYGAIFHEEIKDYDFWAYGDLDLIYGDIRLFATEELLNEYDRCFACGHLSIIRNNKQMRDLYKKKVEGCLYYRDVYSSPQSFTFDEWGRGEYGGYNQICQTENVKVYNHVEYADIGMKYMALKCDFGGDVRKRQYEHKKKKVHFLFNRGHLYQLWKNPFEEKKEVAYIHLQKRIMRNACQNRDEFYIYSAMMSNRKFRFWNTVGFNPQYIKFRLKNLRCKIKEKIN